MPGIASCDAGQDRNPDAVHAVAGYPGAVERRMRALPEERHMSSPKRPVDWVDPLIDTAKPMVRWVFSASACRPFGMVNLSPDTDPVGTWASGYRYGTDTIACFSHIHEWQLSGVPIMPTTGPFRGAAGWDACRSRYRHETEIVRPGYHSVFLDDYGIRAELTCTDRVGLHRYTFPRAEQAHILLNLGAELGPSCMADVLARKVSDTEIEGYVINDVTRRRPKTCHVYFVIRFSKPFVAFGGWTGERLLGDVDEVAGKRSGASVRYSTSEGEVIQLKVGISYVSVDQARLNLDAEAPDWDFDRVRDESTEAWNEYLSRIEVEGGTEAQRTKFYTDVWRCLLGGHLVSDVDGKYSDMTGEQRVVRQVPLDADGLPQYPLLNAQGFWGAHWGLSLLFGLAYPGIVSHYCQFLVSMYRDGGLIPRGPSGGNYTFVMIGSHSTAFLVAAYMKGIRTVDVEAAYEGMRRNAFPGGLMSKAGYEHDSCIGGGVEYYIERGYIPEGRDRGDAMHQEGAAQTLEFAYDDWCLAQMARALGKQEDYELFAERAGNYRNLFDASTGFMRPRNMDGSWLEPFDPLSLTGWCEANSWQYTWYVPHDVQGLIQLFGGPEAFREKLNHGFEQAVPMAFYAAKPEPRRDAAYVNYGNEPGRFVAHLFNHAGAPWLAQKWARRVKDATFGSVEPMGFCEDDDQGLAAGTSAMLALGLFDVQGGAALDPIYEITSPVFDRVVVHLDGEFCGGGEFTIEARSNSVHNVYIQSATLNGEPLGRPWFYHRELAAGGKLVLELGPEPNEEWGSRPEDAPPSMGSECGVIRG